MLLRIFPGYSAIGLRLKGTNHWRAALSLCDDHVRQRDVAREPTAVAHLGEHLPHADQARAAAGGIDHVRRQCPAQLLGELEAHRLLPLDAVPVSYTHLTLTT